ncbi:MAG TPA: hypothetical protein VKM72_11800 [Thermoanaerobaculia bacterium]|nr:hypothetical protein [Thermoanaerobaculia bacterium]
MKPVQSPALSAARAFRLLDPRLSGLASHRGSESEGLAAALIDRGFIDEWRTARDLAGQLLGSGELPLDGLFELARGLVGLRAGIPSCADPVLWHRLCPEVDADLLIAARLALIEQPPPRENATPALSWPSVLSSDTFLVERLLSQELVDTHVHLGGALPGNFYWIAGMSGFAHLYRTAEWAEEPELWPDAIAEALKDRRHLAHQALILEIPERPLPDDDDIWAEDQPDEAFVDPILAWLMPDRVRRSGLNPVLGERHLLWASLSKILRSSDGAQGELTLLRYLRRRNSFLRHIAYAPGARGLARFQACFRRQHLLFADTLGGDRRDGIRRRRAQRAGLRLERFRTRHALRYQFSDPTDAPWARDQGSGLGSDPVPPSPWRPARQIELRVSAARPATLQARVLRAQLQGFADFVRHDRDAPPLRLGFVYHLLRGPVDEVRETSGFMIEGLLCLLDEVPALRTWVVGIDAAGEEMLLPPRDLAPSFRMVRRRVQDQMNRPGLPPVHLGRTCHAGEDFRDLLTGLRYVDETVELFQLQPGERIGHGLALALDPADWYHGRCEVYPFASDHGLDLLWGLRLARLTDPEISLRPDTDLAHVLHLRLEEAVGLERARQALGWIDSLDRIPEEREVLAMLGLDRSRAPRCLLVDSEYTELVGKLRQRVFRRVELAEVILEVCPTSNLLIGKFPSYDRLPYTNLNRLHLDPAADNEPQILFSINSDDPGMFQTTVANEYRALGQALIATRKYQRRQVVQWLDEARRVGLASTFIPPWSPPTRREILFAISNLGEL